MMSHVSALVRNHVISLSPIMLDKQQEVNPVCDKVVLLILSKNLRAGALFFLYYLEVLVVR